MAGRILYTPRWIALGSGGVYGRFLYLIMGQQD